MTCEQDTLRRSSGKWVLTSPDNSASRSNLVYSKENRKGSLIFVGNNPDKWRTFKTLRDALQHSVRQSHYNRWCSALRPCQIADLRFNGVRLGDNTF